MILNTFSRHNVSIKMSFSKNETGEAAQQRREVIDTVCRRPQAAEGGKRICNTSLGLIKICFIEVIHQFMSPRWLNDDSAARKNAVRIKSKFASGLNINNVITAC